MLLQLIKHPTDNMLKNCNFNVQDNCTFLTYVPQTFIKTEMSCNVEDCFLKRST